MKRLHLVLLAALPLICTAAPITVSSVTASSTCCVYNVDNLINGSGLSSGLHDSDFHHMWLANGATGSLVFDLGAVYALSDTQVWNYNSTISLERSTEDMTVLISSDGISYNSVGDFTLTEGTGNPIPADTLDLGGATGRYVEFNLTSNYGDSGYIGLSEVQFDGSSAVPEPSSAALLLAGIAGIVCLRRRAWRPTI